uniref:Uncharacterized protein n=1 Tax=Aureoumbra lagunensis TaxID=44058 RepID=A0A7S3K3E8_9STRA
MLIHLTFWLASAFLLSGAISYIFWTNIVEKPLLRFILRSNDDENAFSISKLIIRFNKITILDLELKKNVYYRKKMSCQVKIAEIQLITSRKLGFFSLLGLHTIGSNFLLGFPVRTLKELNISGITIRRNHHEETIQETPDINDTILRQDSSSANLKLRLRKIGSALKHDNTSKALKQLADHFAAADLKKTAQKASPISDRWQIRYIRLSSIYFLDQPISSSFERSGFLGSTQDLISYLFSKISPHLTFHSST